MISSMQPTSRQRILLKTDPHSNGNRLSPSGTNKTVESIPSANAEFPCGKLWLAYGLVTPFRLGPESEAPFEEAVSPGRRLPQVYAS